MSSNVRFNIIVRGFDSPEIGTLLLRALQSALEQHGFTQHVFSDLMGDLRNLRVEANTTRWVPIPEASQGRPEFERQVTSALQEIHAGATLQFEWSSRPAVASGEDRAALSVFVPGADGTWVWKRIDAISGQQTELMTLPATVTPMTGEVRFDPRDVEVMLVERGPASQIYRAALAGGPALELPHPPHSMVLGAGYDAQGRAVLFYGDQNLERVEDASGAHWVYEGRSYAISPDDFGPLQNMLASVYRVAERGGFEIVERRVIRQTWPGDLRSLEGWAPRQWADVDVRGDAVAFIAKSIIGADPWSKQWGNADEYIEWYRSDRGTRQVFFRAYRESRGLAPPFIVATQSGLTRLTEWDSYRPYSNDLEGQVRGDYLLLTNGHALARLYRLTTGELLWESPPKARVSLWPAAVGG